MVYPNHNQKLNLSRMSIFQKLRNVQQKLKAPKGQYNSFGKYKYRSCEDIMEAAKPVCHEEKLNLTVTDDIVLIGDRYYVKALASVHDDEGNSVITTGLAREPENKKGMDESQITGAASSYARKYALAGLLALDDTKDADATNTGGQSGGQVAPKSDKKTLTKKIADTMIKDIGHGKAKQVSQALSKYSGKEVDRVKKLLKPESQM